MVARADAVIAASSPGNNDAIMHLPRTRRHWLAALAVTATASGGAALLAAGEAPFTASAAPPAITATTVSIPMPTAPHANEAGDIAGLRLRGVLGYAGGRGAAIFSMADGRQRHVRVGDEIRPGVRLEQIADDHVLVHDNVRTLELALPELAASDGGAPAPAAVAATLDPKRDLANFRLGLKPVGDVSRPRGYRIAAGVPLPMLDRAGLKPGDVVLAVNGQTLDAERLLDLPAELLAASSVEVTYERGGRKSIATIAR